MPGNPADLLLRPLQDAADLEACWRLQTRIWGEYRDRVPPALMRISLAVGGVAAGAFTAGGELVGFVWGLAGYRAGEPVHWSHMLGVEPGWRDHGLGRRLKLYQRELLLAAGVKRAFWTYDPLEARNAHLNLNRLGVEVARYERDYYGGGETSLLHRGLGTDRFVVVWRLDGERAAAALAGGRPGEAARLARAPAVDAPVPGRAAPAQEELPELAAVRVEIPAEIQTLKHADPAAALAWRTATRRAFEAYLGRGLTIDAFYRDPATGRCFYHLSRPS